MKNLKENLTYLKLPNLAEKIEMYLEQAIEQQIDKAEFLQKIIFEEVVLKKQRAVERRIKTSRIPIIKTLDSFEFSHPEKINPERVRHLFNLAFMKNKRNVVFCGGVGMGKSHLAIALGLKACDGGYTVRHCNCVRMINDLSRAHEENRLETAIRAYVRPDLLILDELGYIPLDKRGCDIFFQVISRRYEHASTVITTNRAYQDWAKIFNNDAVVASAIVDRVIDGVETIIIEGESYRTKG
jgi:DNA replication protein DnaC|tara:strand:- start:3 stop:725 length:723 start_codon:yes stop_codon:yes gene_type:complete